MNEITTLISEIQLNNDPTYHLVSFHKALTAYQINYKPNKASTLNKIKAQINDFLNNPATVEQISLALKQEAATLLQNKEEILASKVVHYIREGRTKFREFQSRPYKPETLLQLNDLYKKLKEIQHSGLNAKEIFKLHYILEDLNALRIQDTFQAFKQSYGEACASNIISCFFHLCFLPLIAAVGGIVDLNEQQLVNLQEAYFTRFPNFALNKKLIEDFSSP